MSQVYEVSRYVEEPSLLIALCREVVNETGNSDDLVEAARLKVQLREIAKAMDAIERQGVPVPENLRAEKTRMAAQLARLEQTVAALQSIADGLSNLLEDIQKSLRPWQQDPQRGDNSRTRHPRPSATGLVSNDVLREEIILALQSLGGRAHRQKIFAQMEKQLEGRLTEGDQKWINSNHVFSWQKKVAQLKRKMIAEGVIKSDSPEGIWELVEHK